MKLRSLRSLEEDRRGITLSMPTIVIVILALLVLIIIAASFTGGMAQLIQKIKEILYRPSAVSEDVAISQCKSFCQINAEKGFCAKIKIVGVEEERNCEDLGVSCPGMVCTEVT